MLILLQSITCNYLVSVRRDFLFRVVVGHSLSHAYNYFDLNEDICFVLGTSVTSTAFVPFVFIAVIRNEFYVSVIEL